MKRLCICALVALFALTAAGVFADTNTADQVVSYTVNEVQLISVAGTPSITINAAASAGADLTASTAAASFSLTNNGSAAKIKAAISGTALPAGATLKVVLASVGTGTPKNGDVALGSTDTVLEDGIGPVHSTGNAITYTLFVPASAGVIASGSTTVTYTISD